MFLINFAQIGHRISPYTSVFLGGGVRGMTSSPL